MTALDNETQSFFIIKEIFRSYRFPGKRSRSASERRTLKSAGIFFGIIGMVVSDGKLPEYECDALDSCA